MQGDAGTEKAGAGKCWDRSGLLLWPVSTRVVRFSCVLSLLLHGRPAFSSSFSTLLCPTPRPDAVSSSSCSCSVSSVMLYFAWIYCDRASLPCPFDSSTLKHRQDCRPGGQSLILHFRNSTDDAVQLSRMTLIAQMMRWHSYPSSMDGHLGYSPDRTNVVVSIGILIL